MGIALALGAIVGAQAGASGQVAASVAIALGLGLLYPVSPHSARPYVLCAITGCVIGTVAGHYRAAELPPPYVGPNSVIARATIATDPMIGEVSRFAQVIWVDDLGVARDATAFLPAVPPVGRGDVVEVSANVRERYGEELDVRSLRVIQHATGPEAIRRRMRAYVVHHIAQHVPGSAGSLTLGLLIGDDSALSTDERNAMRLAGLSHITAVSGWNVTLVISIVGLLLAHVGLHGRVWTASQLAALCWYVWIVGLDPPVVRAAIMAVVALIAIRLGRPRHALTSLTLSAAVMTLVTPNIMQSLSFQLSALATFGVSLASSPTQGWQGARAWVAAPMVASGAIGVLTAPLLAMRFGILTIAAIPANAVAAPLVVAATFAGIGVVALGWIPPLASIVGGVTWMASSLLLGTADIFASLPVGHWQFAPPSPAVAAALYVAIGAATAAITSEGRALRRRLTRWAIADPVAAGIACASSTTVFVAALTVM